MKKLSLAILTILLAGIGSTALANPSKYTANYLRNFKSDEVGQKVSVDVAWVESKRKVSTEEYAVVLAHTWDEREKGSGGSIPVVLPDEGLENFLKKYETSPDREGGKFRNRDLDTRRLTGILREVGKGKVLLIDLTDGKVDLSSIKKPDAKLSEKGKPAKPALKKKIPKGKK